MIRAGLISLAMAASPAMAQNLPFDLGGAFTLTNQFEQRRTQADPDGKPQLLFFGYVSCQEICSAVFPLMAEVIAAVEAEGVEVTPVMITVDPKRDTPASMGKELAAFHPDFIGLTGTDAELKRAYDAYSIEKEEVFFDPETGPVYAHGSFLYLLDRDGNFVTLVPPILSADQAAGIILLHTKDAS